MTREELIAYIENADEYTKHVVISLTQYPHCLGFTAIALVGEDCDGQVGTQRIKDAVTFAHNTLKD